MTGESVRESQGTEGRSRSQSCPLSNGTNSCGWAESIKSHITVTLGEQSLIDIIGLQAQCLGFNTQ